VSEPLQLGDAAIDLGGMVKDYVEDVAAGNLAAFAKRDDLANLAQGEADSLGSSHKLETSKDVFVVVAVSARGALGGGKDTDVLVIPQRFDAQPAAVRHLPNSHDRNLPLDSPADWRVHTERWPNCEVLLVSAKQVIVLYFEGCPNWQLAADRLREAVVAAGLSGQVEVTYQTVETPEDAERVAFRGSPTILVDGRDPWADDGGSFGLSCRIYCTETGSEGSPSVAQLTRALAA
jgi:hypothetical protein